MLRRWSVVFMMSTCALHAAEVGKWTSIGPTRISSGTGPDRNAVGRVTSIAVDTSTSQIIYVGARGSGVWKTTNGGATWQPITDSLPSLTIAGLAVAPSQPARVYLTTPLGFYRSNDSGASWTQVSPRALDARAFDGGALLVAPQNPDMLFLSSCGSADGGVQRSTDGGVTWTRTIAAVCNTSLLLKSGTENQLIAGLQMSGGGESGVHESTNGGDSWRRLQGCPGALLPTVGSDTSIKLAQSAGRIYASFKLGGSWRLFRTTTSTCAVGGTTEKGWEPGWQPDEATARTLWSLIQADPVNKSIVYATGTQFWVSTDGGLSFQKPSPQPHVDHHGFAFDPQSPSRIFSGNDGGIYRSQQGRSGTWEFIGNGLANVEFYDIADSPNEPATVIGGTQDNGLSKQPAAGTVWTYVIGGDSEMVEIAAHDKQLWYEAGQAMHQLRRSINAGSSWAGIGTGLPEGCDPWGGEYPANPTAKFRIHPQSPERLLMACGNLFEGLPWAPILSPANDSVASIEVMSNGFYLAGTRNGKIHAGPGGAGWVDVFSSQPPARSSDIEMDPTDPAVVYASFITTRSGRVYRLRRNPGSAPSFSAADITFDLPSSITVKALAVDRMRAFSIFAATDHGVYRARSSNAGSTWSWTAYNNGLPQAVDVRDLEVHPTTGLLRAGTFGRGAFEVFTDDPIGSVLNASGRLTLLRVHDVGTKYGPSTDQLDAEVVIQLDSEPGMAFGYQLRTDSQAVSHEGMLELLRDAFRRNRPVVIDYVRTGFRSGRLVRVMPAAN